MTRSQCGRRDSNWVQSGFPVGYGQLSTEMGDTLSGFVVFFGDPLPKSVASLRVPSNQPPKVGHPVPFCEGFRGGGSRSAMFFLPTGRGSGSALIAAMFEESDSKCFTWRHLSPSSHRGGTFPKSDVRRRCARQTCATGCEQKNKC